MPRRNAIKPKLAGTNYHVWHRGIGRKAIFRDRDDRRFFLQLLKRYLSQTAEFSDSSGRRYRKLHDQVRLLSFCLMGNHFHLVLHQVTHDGVERLMRSVMRAYVGHFNAKYGSKGPLFSGPYRARALSSPGQTRTAIAYVHDNHGVACECEFCSNRFFLGDLHAPSWISVDQAIEIFGGAGKYRRFRRGRRTMKDLTA
jgi:REP element-mobilizing transposase RayT